LNGDGLTPPNTEKAREGGADALPSLAFLLFRSAKSVEPTPPDLLFLLEIPMRDLLRYTLALIAAATIYGLAKPVAMQAAPPIVSQFAPATPIVPEADVLVLPRVVPPPKAAPPKNLITPVSFAAPKPAVDLLTAPTVPPAWLTAPNRSAPSQLVVIPSGLPSRPPAALAAPVHAALAPKIAPTPVVAASVAPALIPLAVATTTVRPTLQPLTTAGPPIRSWPPAHVVRKNVPDQETRGVAYFETAPTRQAPAAVIAVPASPK
jgi:hypothetical protein